MSRTTDKSVMKAMMRVVPPQWGVRVGVNRDSHVSLKSVPPENVGFTQDRWAATGRERQFVAFRCSRSAGILCRAMVATRERPLSPSLTFSAA
jgi:hypothetical protein